jgi:hypothetical protein
MKKCDFQVVFKRPLTSPDDIWEKASEGLCLALKDGCSVLKLHPGPSKINFRINWEKASPIRFETFLEIPVLFNRPSSGAETALERATHLWAEIKRALLLLEPSYAFSTEAIDALDVFVAQRQFGSVIIGKRQRPDDNNSAIKWARVEAHIYPEKSNLLLRCGLKDQEVCAHVADIDSSYFVWRRYFGDLTFSERTVTLAAKIHDGKRDKEVQFKLVV